MTKAELLHRVRWVFALLPLATAAGFYVLFVSGKIPPTGAVLPSGFHSAWRTSLVFAPLAWVLLTFVCSTLSMLMLADHAKMRGVLRLIFALVVAAMIACLHAVAWVSLRGLHSQARTIIYKRSTFLNLGALSPRFSDLQGVDFSSRT